MIDGVMGKGIPRLCMGFTLDEPVYVNCVKSPWHKQIGVIREIVRFNNGRVSHYRVEVYRYKNKDHMLRTFLKENLISAKWY